MFAVLAGTQRVCVAGGSTAKVSLPDPDALQIAYPKTKRGTVTESQFGVSVPDPCRWLEGDPRTDKIVAAWIDGQQRLTTDYLSNLPGRDVVRRSLASTYDYERLGIPQKSGDRYFFTRKAGNQNQPVLVMRDADGAERILIGPAITGLFGRAMLIIGPAWAINSRGQGLEVAVVVHTMYDTLSFLLAKALRTDLSQRSERSAGAANIAALVPIVVVAVATGIVWYKRDDLAHCVLRIIEMNGAMHQTFTVAGQKNFGSWRHHHNINSPAQAHGRAIYLGGIGIARTEARQI
ncbi:hypothetical protein [Phyllobacterium bourgognense]|uniref:hypothetical protein n=1 Tax=Phyllobacterium bourgognense TaxID=314236 RepID=UPI001FDF681B|nr:hypothetical protein [Phyllobacterium bourgognense]